MTTCHASPESNDDGDFIEKGKHAIGLDWQNSNFARSSCFFVHFFAVAARCNVKVPIIARFVEDVNEDNDFYFSFLEL